MATSDKNLALPASGDRVALSGVSANAYGSSVLVTNPGPGLIEIGGDDLSATNGFPLPSGSSLGCDLSEGEKLYARSPTGAAEAVHVLRVA